MGFYDSDTYDSWGGTGGKYEPDLRQVSYSELLEAFHENGITSEDNSDLILGLFLANRIDRWENKSDKIALMRKGEMFEAGFHEYGWNPARTSVEKLDFHANKAIGKTFNGGQWSKHRKYWDWECPLKFLYFYARVPFPYRTYTGFFINFTGTEVIIVDEDWKVLKRHRTKPSEAIEFLKILYERSPYWADGFDDVLEKIERKYKFIRG